MNMSQFKGKKVLVTGSSSGIGAAAAMLYAKGGAFVGVHYKSNLQGAERVFSDVKKNSDGMLLKADVTKPEQISKMIKDFTAECGGIDILPKIQRQHLNRPVPGAAEQ